MTNGEWILKKGIRFGDLKFSCSENGYINVWFDDEIIGFIKQDPDKTHFSEKDLNKTLLNRILNWLDEECIFTEIPEDHSSTEIGWNETIKNLSDLADKFAASNASITINTNKDKLITVSIIDCSKDCDDETD